MATAVTVPALAPDDVRDWARRAGALSPVLAVIALLLVPGGGGAESQGGEGGDQDQRCGRPCAGGGHGRHLMSSRRVGHGGVAGEAVGSLGALRIGNAVSRERRESALKSPET